MRRKLSSMAEVAALRFSFACTSRQGESGASPPATKARGERGVERRARRGAAGRVRCVRSAKPEASASVRSAEPGARGSGRTALAGWPRRKARRRRARR
eukprot:3192923-Prymnesium_polylepis.1